MLSAAYRDYASRMVEPRVLVRDALEAREATRAAALSKGAAVLAAAALERYINEVIVELCGKVAATEWKDLTEGQQRYMARQISRALYVPVRAVHRKGEDTRSRRDRLQKVVQRCATGFDDPSSWKHSAEYGLFMDGAAEPEKIQAALRDFDSGGRKLFDFVDQRSGDRAAIARSVSSLITARHQAAHALRGVASGPTDVRAWIVLSLILVRHIEAYLGFRT
jgi:hypothetical protein